jgi:alkanesulfonate monooxygenase SsuD/methylene tetrahydromethanopterin reductase-like flavin-dependent oxidoreductase (luciferase family)
LVISDRRRPCPGLALQLSALVVVHRKRLPGEPDRCIPRFYDFYDDYRRTTPGALMQFTIALPQANRVSTLSALRDVAQAAEELGFWALSMHDHIMWDGLWIACGSDTDNGGEDLRNIYEPLTTYAHLSAITERVRLLFSIMLLPSREPLMTAKQLSTLDQLSGGRVSLGIGVGLAGNHTDPPYLSALSGNAGREWEALGVPVRRRGRLSDERLAAMQALWTEDIATFQGELVRFTDIAMYPKPAQPGGIPILVGGNSRAALKRVARGGFSWLPNHSKPGELAMGIEHLKKLHEEYGTEFTGEVVHDCFIRLDNSVEAASASFPRVLRDALGEEFSQRNLLGNAEDLIGRIREYEASGVTALDLKPVYHSIDELLTMMRRFAKEVMPAVM